MKAMGKVNYLKSMFSERDGCKAGNQTTYRSVELYQLLNK